MKKVSTAALALAVIAPLTQLPMAASAATVRAAPSDDSGLSDVNTKRLRKNVTVGGILSHERVFQRIANKNEGTRASGTAGFDQSARYVQRRLENAGYRVRRQEFTFPFFRDLSDPALEQLTPDPQPYETATFTYSGSGEVEGALVPTNDVQVPPPAEPGSTSGCEPGDFEPASAEPESP